MASQQEEGGCPVQASNDDHDGMLQYAAALHRVCQSRVEPIPDGNVVLRERDRDEMEELQILHHQSLCKTCFQENASIMFLPCTHLSACPACAAKLQNCNVCLQLIEVTVRAYCS